MINNGLEVSVIDLKGYEETNTENSKETSNGISSDSDKAGAKQSDGNATKCNEKDPKKSEPDNLKSKGEFQISKCLFKKV